ncbi:MAG: alcohol dehydrogenase catalytic domain-containing protein [Bacteroidales bacterium]
MRQATMTSPGHIVFQEVPEPGPPAGHQVLLRIRRIGICGSDVHVYHGKHPATPYPVIQGHEYSAVVEAVGANVDRTRPGDRVTARPQLVCGTCGPCRRGQYNACQNLRVEGFQAPGVARDLVLVDEDRVVVLDPALSPEQGALVEPAAVGAHATGRTDLRDRNVLVSGAGTIGNLVAQSALARGARRVVITDVSPFRLEIARQSGIGSAVLVDGSSLDQKLQEAFGGEGFQVGFEAAGVQASLDVLLRHVEKGGDVVVLGVYEKNPVVNMYYLGEHELNVYGSMMYRHEDYETAAAWLASGTIRTQALISKVFPFEAYPEAYAWLDEQADRCMKVMLTL